MCSLGAGVGLELIVARYLSVSLVAEQAIAMRSPGVSASSANDAQGCSEYYLIMYHVTIAAQVFVPPTTSQSQEVSVASFAGKLSNRMAARCVSCPSF
jgi:hypothetical protein